MKSDKGLGSLWLTHLPWWHWQRVEVGLISAGVPDVNGCCAGVEVWVENKGTETDKVEVRPAQVAWHMRRTRAGGRTFVAVRKVAPAGPRRGGRVDSLYIYPGWRIALLRDEGLLGPEPLGVWTGGPAFWDWRAVEVVLKTRASPGA